MWIDFMGDFYDVDYGAAGKECCFSDGDLNDDRDGKKIHVQYRNTLRKKVQEKKGGTPFSKKMFMPKNTRPIRP
jgi:hypothetical protein